MSETPPQPPTNQENASFVALRNHVTNLEQQLSTVKITNLQTETEKALLASQLDAAKLQLAEAEKLKTDLEQATTRNALLDGKFTKLVEKELAKFPATKLDAVKNMVSGLTPEQQFDKLGDLISLMDVTTAPPPGNPPPPPNHSNNNNTNNNNPPADGPSELDLMKEAVKRGESPFNLLTLSRPKPGEFKV